MPRMLLSYDAAFLGMVMDGTAVYKADDEEKIDISGEHCLVHPIKKKTIVKSSGVDYAADVMLILAWHNLEDDVKDEGKITSGALKLMLNSKYRELEKTYPDLCKKISVGIGVLNKLEKEKTPGLDVVAETFAKIMEVIFTGDGKKRSEYVTNSLQKLGYHLGKWIYLMDAWEDIDEDIEKGTYNPLIYRHELGEGETGEEFRKRIKGNVEFNLMMYLSAMGDAIENLDIKDNSGIIENIVYMGLLRRTEKALGKENAEDEQKPI